jgi:hypothetical protein
MDASLGLLTEGISLAKSIAELLGILESIDSKVDRLMESELKTGMLELQQAVNSDTERVELLRSARQRFNKAITLETGYKLSLSYVGLAVCHSHLKDRANTRKALQDAVAVGAEISTKDWISATLNDSYNPINMFNPKRLKQQFRDTFKFRKNLQTTLGMLKKEAAIGPTTEGILEERKKLLALQEIARVELNASPGS